MWWTLIKKLRNQKTRFGILFFLYLKLFVEVFALYLTIWSAQGFWEDQNNFTPLLSVDFHGFRTDVQFYSKAYWYRQCYCWLYLVCMTWLKKRYSANASCIAAGIIIGYNAGIGCAIVGFISIPIGGMIIYAGAGVLTLGAIAVVICAIVWIISSLWGVGKPELRGSAPIGIME